MTDTPELDPIQDICTYPRLRSQLCSNLLSKYSAVFQKKGLVNANKHPAVESRTDIVPSPNFQSALAHLNASLKIPPLSVPPSSSKIPNLQTSLAVYKVQHHNGLIHTNAATNGAVNEPGIPLPLQNLKDAVQSQTLLVRKTSNASPSGGEDDLKARFQKHRLKMHEALFALPAFRRCSGPVYADEDSEEDDTAPISETRNQKPPLSNQPPVQKPLLSNQAPPPFQKPVLSNQAPPPFQKPLLSNQVSSSVQHAPRSHVGSAPIKSHSAFQLSLERRIQEMRLKLSAKVVAQQKIGSNDPVNSTTPRIDEASFAHEQNTPMVPKGDPMHHSPVDHSPVTVPIGVSVDEVIHAVDPKSLDSPPVKDSDVDSGIVQSTCRDSSSSHEEAPFTINSSNRSQSCENIKDTSLSLDRKHKAKSSILKKCSSSPSINILKKLCSKVRFSADITTSVDGILDDTDGPSTQSSMHTNLRTRADSAPSIFSLFPSSANTNHDIDRSPFSGPMNDSVSSSELQDTRLDDCASSSSDSESEDDAHLSGAISSKAMAPPSRILPPPNTQISQQRDTSSPQMQDNIIYASYVRNSPRLHKIHSPKLRGSPLVHRSASPSQSETDSQVYERDLLHRHGSPQLSSRNHQQENRNANLVEPYAVVDLRDVNTRRFKLKNAKCNPFDNQNSPMKNVTIVGLHHKQSFHDCMSETDTNRFLVRNSPRESMPSVSDSEHGTTAVRDIESRLGKPPPYPQPYFKEGILDSPDYPDSDPMSPSRRACLQEHDFESESLSITARGTSDSKSKLSSASASQTSLIDGSDVYEDADGSDFVNSDDHCDKGAPLENHVKTVSSRKVLHENESDNESIYSYPEEGAMAMSEEELVYSDIFGDAASSESSGLESERLSLRSDGSSFSECEEEVSPYAERTVCIKPSKNLTNEYQEVNSLPCRAEQSDSQGSEHVYTTLKKSPKKSKPKEIPEAQTKGGKEPGSDHEISNHPSPAVPFRGYLEGEEKPPSNLLRSKSLSASLSSLSKKMGSVRSKARKALRALRPAKSSSTLAKDSSDEAATPPSHSKTGPSSASYQSPRTPVVRKALSFGNIASIGRRLKRKAKGNSKFSPESVRDSKLSPFVENPQHFRPIGKLLYLNKDGTQLVQFTKPPHGPFGFYIAKDGPRGKAYVSRMSDSYDAKLFVGLIAVGDEILQINGKPTEKYTLQGINTLVATQNKIVLHLRSPTLD